MKDATKMALSCTLAGAFLGMTCVVVLFASCEPKPPEQVQACEARNLDALIASQQQTITCRTRLVTCMERSP